MGCVAGTVILEPGFEGREIPRDRRSLGGAEDRMGLRILDGELGMLQGQIHLGNSELKTSQTLQELQRA